MPDPVYLAAYGNRRHIADGSNTQTSLCGLACDMGPVHRLISPPVRATYEDMPVCKRCDNRWNKQAEVTP